MYRNLCLAALACCLPAASAVADTQAALELEDCRIHAGPGYPGIKARCGSFERPENPDDPGSARILLNVAVVAALSLEPEPDPFVPIAGGPGGATVRFYAAYAQAFEKVRRNRDILLLDQRGTGESARMECDVGDEIIEGQISYDETVAYTRDCLDTLPYDPRYFTTSVAVHDLEALRVALGYGPLNLYGSSYGTRVAQHFARRYPDSTRSVILDGVAPPQIALGPAIAVEAQKALDAIFERCEEDPACSERFPGIAGEFAALRSRLEDAPAQVALPNPVTGRPESITFGHIELAAAIRLLSYSPNTVALMPFLIHEAAMENYVPLASQYLMIMETMSDALALGMHNAVVCTEDAPYFEGENVSGEMLASTYIGPIMMEALSAMCSIWPRGVMDEDLRKPLATGKPVLLLSGDADPVTPPRFAELAAVDLKSARHLIGADQGHGQAPRGCMPDIIGRFVDSGTIDDLGENCYLRVFAMPFFLDYAGPSP